MDATGILDEAYQRLHLTGPEFDGWLSNHGPMAAEAMVYRGHPGDVHSWLDRYCRRLEDLPRGIGPIGPAWQEALGDSRRIADWVTYFRRGLAGHPWQAVLGTWWPRLLPGVAAAATHGVIRTGHAVRSLLAESHDEIRITELAHGLAYWAARWQALPVTTALPAFTPAEPATAVVSSLASLPRIADQSGDIGERLRRPGRLPDWPTALAATSVPADVEQARSWLAGLVEGAVTQYLRYGHGDGIMLVHAATAPNAVLRTLPALDAGLWVPSAAAAWSAAAALTVIYAPAEPAPAPLLPDPPTGPQAAEELFARAVEHGDEHVIKFADTATDVYARTGNADALASAVRATSLIERR